MIKKILLFTFIVVSIFANAQITGKPITSFPHDHVKFLRIYNNFMSQGPIKKDEIKVLMKQFSLMWEEDSISKNKKDEFITFTNKLIKKRQKQYPIFYDYTKSLISFNRSTQSDESYKAWNTGINNMIDNPKISIKKVRELLHTTTDIINKSVIYKSTALTWEAVGTDSYFIYDKELKLRFDNDFDLTCFAKNDSIKIEQTNGVYYFLNNSWKGVNGKVTWERAGYDKDKVFANLRRYSINMRKSEYTADSVSFVNSLYLKKPALGRLDEKLLHILAPEKATYPQFTTYLTEFEIKDIYPDINYTGGFYVKGYNLLGIGIEKHLAHIEFYRKDTLVLEAKSKMFIFKQDGINSQKAEITLRLDTDSIYHPGLILKYTSKNRTLLLIREKKGKSRTLFYDSYHDVEMDVITMEWDMTTPKIDFGGITQSDKSITFTSVDYFTRQDYDNIQLHDEVNPVVAIYSFSNQLGDRYFEDKEFGNFMRMSEPAMHRYLLNLAYLGFINYNYETKQVFVKDKTFNYVKASVNKRDYDVIKFLSNTGSGSKTSTNKKGLDINASLSLLNHNLKIAGIRYIHLSDSQDVRIYPNEGMIVLKKNRDFDFSGKVRAGNFLYIGTNFSFEYDKFKIDMPDIAKMKLQVLSNQIGRDGNPIPVTVKTSLENMSGELFIDNMMNKSGAKSYPRYPIFKSKKDAYVYYDAPNISEGVYKRDNFYFQVFPYEMDSLDNIDRNSIKFEGHFVSAGIFPPFDESLKVMRDYSLGFTRFTPPSGYKVYGGKANYKNLIDLSNEGLRGAGDLEYITSISKSDEFKFYPDSMNADVKSFDNKEQIASIEFPQVLGTDVYTHWEPYNDQMFTSKVYKEIKMFNDQAVLHGTTVLGPSGMTGFGKMEFVDAVMSSNLYVYKQNTFDSDTANFNLKSLDLSEGFDFKTDNVNAHIDFNERLGEFVSNDGNSTIEFPKNQYICFMDKFTWYMDKEELMLSSTEKNLELQKVDTAGLSPTELEDVELVGSQFISLHPRQDSLNFFAPTANYNRRTGIITANDVKFIRVADATVYPGDGKVVVEKQAKMQTLKESKIRANNTTRYHHFFNCLTTIYGKKDYMASGDYNYIDETKSKQVIHFDVIAVDDSVQTYATGKIGVTEDFTLSPRFAYTGGVRLTASKEFLTFFGSTKINHECENLKRYWVNFEGEIDPEDIYIPINSKMKDINDNTIHSSIMMAHDSTGLYSAFLTPHLDYHDQELMSIEGYLHYDKSDGQYKIANKEKLTEFSLPGNFISLHPTICNVYTEGLLNLGVDFGQLKTQIAGNISNNMSKNTFKLDLVMVLDFFFSEKCMQVMAKELEAVALDPTEFGEDKYEKAIADIIGKEKAEKFLTSHSLGSFKKYPEELEKTMVITDIKLNWDVKTRTYLSDGEIGIGNLYKTQVNRLTEGIVEIVKKRSGDKITIYLEPSEGVFYYFSYMRGVLRVTSSNEEFNTIMKETKTDDRKMKIKKGEKTFMWYAASPKEAIKFKKKFEESDETEGDETGEDKGFDEE